MNSRGNITVIIAAIIVAFVIFLGGYLLLRKKSENPPEAPAQSEQNNNSSQPDNSQLTVGALSPDNSQATSAAPAIKNNMHMIALETNYGKIEFTTYDADAPKTVKNFIGLAQKGFYDNLTFHRVIKGFMIQGGDPNGNGSGGPGYQFEDELNPAAESYKAGYKRGVVAMANAGPNTNGSQFFIMHQDYSLPNNYTIFGKVTKGQEVVDTIANAQTDANDKPLTPVIIKKVTVSEK